MTLINLLLTTSQENRTFITYNCDEKSQLSKISRIVTDYILVECNAIYLEPNSNTVEAKLPNGTDIPILWSTRVLFCMTSIVCHLSYKLMASLKF